MEFSLGFWTITNQSLNSPKYVPAKVHSSAVGEHVKECLPAYCSVTFSVSNIKRKVVNLSSTRNNIPVYWFLKGLVTVNNIISSLSQQAVEVQIEDLLFPDLQIPYFLCMRMTLSYTTVQYRRNKIYWVFLVIKIGFVQYTVLLLIFLYQII